MFVDGADRNAWLEGHDRTHLDFVSYFRERPEPRRDVVSIMAQLDGALHHDIDLPDIEAVLDAQMRAGYGVVKLPEPAGMDEDGQIWFDYTEIRVDTTGSEPEIFTIGRNQVTVEQIRAEAAELLSIAALVDAIKAGTE